MFDPLVQLYCGLGAFRGLEPRSPENMLTFIEMDVSRDPLKDFSRQVEDKKLRSYRSLTVSKSDSPYNQSRTQIYTISLIIRNYSALSTSLSSSDQVKAFFSKKNNGFT